MVRSVLSVLALSSAFSLVHAITLNIENLCTDNVDLYDNSATVTLSPGGTTSRTLANGFVGMFRDGTSDEATLCEISIDSGTGKVWYDISIIPPSPGSCSSLTECQEVTGKVGFNTAMSVTPQSNVGTDTCAALTCLADGCDDAYQYPSDDTKTHTCASGTNFLLTFCPGGSGGSTTTTTSGSSTTGSTTATTTPTPTPTPTTATPTPSPSEVTSSSAASATNSANSATNEGEIANEASSTGFSLFDSSNSTSSSESDDAEDSDAGTVTATAESETTTSTSTSTTTGATSATAATSDSTGSTDKAVEINTQSSSDSGSSIGYVFLGVGAFVGMVAASVIVVVRKKKRELDEMETKTPVTTREVSILVATPNDTISGRRFSKLADSILMSALRGDQDAEEAETSQPQILQPLTRAIVQQHLSVLGKNPFTQAHIFTTATLTNLLLTDLYALSDFRFIQHVQCNQNKLQSLAPLQHLSLLLSVDASDNQLTQALDYDVPQCTHTNAWVGGGEWIGSLLRRADLSRNQIAVIRSSLSESHPFLQELYLAHNQLKEITGLDKLRFLRILDLSHNQLVSLRGLASEDNQETTLQSLEILLLRHNAIVSVEEVALLPRLHHLDLAYNQMRHLNSIGKCYKLQKLDLSHNEIDDMNEVNHLIPLRYLQTLVLQDCPLDNKEESSVFYRARVLRRLPKLKQLDDDFVSTKEKVKARAMHGSDLISRQQVFAKYLPTQEFTNFLPPLEFESDEELERFEERQEHNALHIKHQMQ